MEKTNENFNLFFYIYIESEQDSSVIQRSMSIFPSFSLHKDTLAQLADGTYNSFQIKEVDYSRELAAHQTAHALTAKKRKTYLTPFKM